MVARKWYGIAASSMRSNSSSEELRREESAESTVIEKKGRRAYITVTEVTVGSYEESVGCASPRVGGRDEETRRRRENMTETR